MKLSKLLGFFLTFIFLSSFASAQLIGLTGEELYAIAVILMVIIAIAIVAGWKMRVGIPSGIIIFGLIVLLLVVLPFFVKIPEEVIIPKTWKLAKLPEFLMNGMVYMGLPKDWGYVPAFIYLVILPFAAVFAITWGFLNQLKIFDKRVVRVLSLLITFSTMPFGIFSKMVYFYFAISGFFGISTFVATFILGLFLLAFRRVSVYELKIESIRSLRTQLDAVHQEYREIARRVREAAERRNWEEVAALNEKMRGLENAMRALENRIRELTA